MSFQEQKNRLLQITARMESDLNKYKLTKGAKPYAIKKQQDMIDSVREFVGSLDAYINDLLSEQASEIKEMYEVVKKQQLIIKSAGIVYPTINQDIRTIQDIFYVSTNQLNKIGSGVVEPVTIDII